jgi:nitric oxide reductase subunit B
MLVSLRRITQVLLVTVLLSMAAMVAGAVYTYRLVPPVPERVVTPDGNVLYTAHDIAAGKVVFQRRSLMDYGTVLGNGAYFGPDFTAEYLERMTALLRAAYAREQYGHGFQDLGPAAQAAVADRVRRELKHSAVQGSTLTVSPTFAAAHREIRQWYADRFVHGDLDAGIAPGTIRLIEEAERFADFSGWTAWFSVANRPGRDYSYTNNWPPDPAAGNTATALNFFWTVATIGIVFLMIGVLLLAYRYVTLEAVTIRAVPDVRRFTPGELQQGILPLFAVAAALFVVQTLAGGYLANAFASRADFYGIFTRLGLHRMAVLPFQALRAVHLDLAVFWVLAMWMASALFLAPFLGGDSTPALGRGARWLAGILVVSVAGSLGGIYLGTLGTLDRWWYWLGSEGLEYVEMGRLWKLGIIVAFALWLWLTGRSLLRRVREPVGHLPRLLVATGGAIALAFLASLAYRPETNFVVTDFWRWWTVHLWVEGVFAFFQLVVTAILLGGMGLVSGGVAAKSIYFEAVLVLLAGILAIGHHYWWVGEPSMWLGVGSVFSTLEIVPLVVLLFHAAEDYIKVRRKGTAFPHRVAFLFIAASGIWQFFGSGVLGLLINFPLVNYYEHGTYLTVAHSHGSFMGGFGFLAIGLTLFCLRYAAPPDRWRERPLAASFWALNIGLVLMLFVSVMPVGFLQLQEAYAHGFAAARSLAFYDQPIVHALMKWRLPGDLLIVLGALVLFREVLRGVWLGLAPRSPAGTAGGNAAARPQPSR